MGNKISKAKHKENMGKLKLPNLLDHIATKYITTQKVANAIMIIGFIIFICKLIFWYWDKKRENLSE